MQYGAQDQAQPHYVNPHEISSKLTPGFELREYNQKVEEVYDTINKM